MFETIKTIVVEMKKAFAKNRADEAKKNLEFSEMINGVTTRDIPPIEDIQKRVEEEKAQ